MVNKLKRIISVFAVNHIFKGTRWYSIKRKLLNFGGIRCGKNVRLVGPLYIGTMAELSVDDNSFIGTNFKVYGNGKVSIGSNVDIAPEVAFLTGSHEISDESVHRAGKGLSFSIKVGDGCWIGARTSITGNTEIGHGTVVGACSLVLKSIGDNGVYVGIPVRRIREI